MKFRLKNISQSSQSNRLAFIGLLTISVVIVFSVACNRKGQKIENTATTGNTRIAVDETFKPIVEALLPVFHAVYSYANVEVDYIPEVDALNALFRDSVYLAIVPRSLTKDEISYFNSKKLFPKETKVALDGIAVLVHPSNTDTLFTMNQLKKIFLGEINNWNQINPDSKRGTLKVVVDNPKSSIVRFVVDSITGSANLGTNVSAFEYNRDVVEFVSQTPNAIGLIGVSWISDRNDPSCLTFLKKVHIAAISKAEKAIPENSYQPYQAYFATGKYPLTRYMYIINTEPRAGLSTGFSAFAAGDKGQRIILKTGILPYMQPVRLIQVKENF